MRKTSVTIELGVFDETAKNDMSLAVEGDLQPFSLPYETFIKDAVDWDKWATLEHNRFTLDGTMVPFPDDMSSRNDWGLWGLGLSGDDGETENPIVLLFEFPADHTSYGLTFHFDEKADEWVKSLFIQWIDANENVVVSELSNPTASTWYVNKQVSRFRKIRVTMSGTSKPGRYIKLSNIDFGRLFVFSGHNVVNASITESADQTSNELQKNDLQWTGIVDGQELNPLNPHSTARNFRPRQRANVYYEVNGTRHFMGRFYLSEWVSESENQMSFTAYDVIDVLDNSRFYGGMYTTTAGDLISEILDGYEYKIEDGLESEIIEGWIPITTRREALQMVTFRLGAIVDTSRSSIIRIYKPITRGTRVFKYSQKGLGDSSVSVNNDITAIEIQSYRYTKDGEETQVYHDTPGEDDVMVTFSQPHYDYAVENGVLVEVHPNYIVVAASDREVLIYGKPYKEVSYLHTIENQDAPVDAEDNVVYVENNTLVSKEDCDALGKSLLAYYSQTIIQTISVLLDDEKLSELGEVYSFGGQSVRGYFEDMRINLTRGGKTKITIAGHRVNTDWKYYATDYGELYAGGNSLI